jgi:hypothetical protein
MGWLPQSEAAQNKASAHEGEEEEEQALTAFPRHIAEFGAIK